MNEYSDPSVLKKCMNTILKMKKRNNTSAYCERGQTDCNLSIMQIEQLKHEGYIMKERYESIDEDARDAGYSVAGHNISWKKT